MILEKDGVELNLFTTITTLGTPHDATVHELRLESFFRRMRIAGNGFLLRSLHGFYRFD